MKFFSERNGYINPSDIIIKNKLTDEIRNAISNSFTYLQSILNELDEKGMRSESRVYISYYSYIQLNQALWTEYLNNRISCFPNNYDLIQAILLDDSKQWYIKLDIIEFSISFLKSHCNDNEHCSAIIGFINEINEHFEKFHFGYRIVNGIITEIINKDEIKSIEQAEETSSEITANHLQRALTLYSQRPYPDYRNSIKESISAVESLLRSHTGENTFGTAYSKIKKEITIHPQILSFIQKVYDYTNQEDTGIRHSKIDLDETHLPSAEEAQLMLIICSAIINYFIGKLSKITK